MSETPASICAWAEDTFGITDIEQLVARTNEEMAELISAAAAGAWGGAPTHGVAGECADVYIMLVQVCEMSGVDLHDAVDAKMALNRSRKWTRDARGNAQHER